MVGIIARLQPGGPFRSQSSDNTSADNLCLPVPSQIPAHHLGPLDAVRDLPGGRFEPQQCKFDGEIIFIAFDIRVHAACVRIQDAPVMLR